ncbi:Signal transduction histidine kinase [Sporobacter termitidis DSM 10068]|uniref:histidine kinase n=1 Tax=Sporobacter termitidis DSM 10068 TaxID=1123282 RepID=A0A1M5YW32_9FIRM|nr:HAMP domain-containing sensor histidine kinase [Sporobacter termitidis]SHI16266.1 Signal transduction histidine kinase [Sporobacter termitidis DSM 10068]
MRKNEKRHSSGLRQRWIRSSVLIVLITVLVVILAFSLFIYSNYYSTVQTGLETKAKTATDFFSNYVVKSNADYYDGAYRYTESFDDSDRLELQFIDTDGRVMRSTYGISAGSSPGTPDISRAISTGQISSWSGTAPSTGERIMSVSAPMRFSGNQVIGVMRYVTSLKLVDRQVIFSILAVVALGGVIMLLVVFINLVFIRSVIEPVSEITKMSKRIAQGSYGIQIKKDYHDEIGEMVDSINEMSLKIAQSEKVQTEFISSISHELRTPLTAITGWGETLIYNEHMDGETKKGIAIILKEARRLTKMVEELLEFTRMEDGRFTLNIEMIDIVAELEDSIFTYRELLHQDELELVYEPYMEEMPLIPGDPSRLKQVFLNLFDNAAKYGREGKRIEVSVDMDSAFVYIKIRDFGPGIPEDELDHVKMKFYKGSNAKERGSGIGLAVCDEIIRFHGGTLLLENAEGGGLCVTIKLPVSSSI